MEQRKTQAISPSQGHSKAQTTPGVINQVSLAGVNKLSAQEEQLSELQRTAISTLFYNHATGLWAVRQRVLDILITAFKVITQKVK